jgi:hypothetical protein
MWPLTLSKNWSLRHKLYQAVLRTNASYTTVGHASGPCQNHLGLALIAAAIIRLTSPDTATYRRTALRLAPQSDVFAPRRAASARVAEGSVSLAKFA